MILIGVLIGILIVIAVTLPILCLVRGSGEYKKLSKGEKKECQNKVIDRKNGGWTICCQPAIKQCQKCSIYVCKYCADYYHYCSEEK